MVKNSFHFILFLLFLVFSCEHNEYSNTKQLSRFQLLPAEKTGISFENTLEYTEEFNTYTYRNFYNGAGVGIGDFNNDGWADIYFAGNIVDNKLYLNNGDFTFSDITEKAGVACPNIWSTGVSIIDINGDGFLDIYVCKSGSPGGDNRFNELFLNNGPDIDGIPTFTEVAEQYGVADKGLSAHASFVDYDKDGDLDFYLLNNSFSSVGGYSLIKDQREIRDPLGGNKLYRNDGERFTDVSEEAGIYGSAIGFGLGVSIGDFNNDNWPDIYVCNDFFERDYLYLNKRDGTFTEELEHYFREISMGSMGSDFADINNDGYPELFVTEMTPEPEGRLKTKAIFQNWDQYMMNIKMGYYHQFARNVLQLNHGNGHFSEIGRYAGVYATDWSWGALIMDLDNDGWKDIYVANGIYKDLLDQDYLEIYSNPDQVRMMINQEEDAILKMIEAIPSEKIPNYTYRNNRDLTFLNVAQEWGTGDPGFSNGAAYGDLDNDGDLDLVVNNVNMPPFLYRNLTSENDPKNFLMITLKGEGNNSQAVGAKAWIYLKDTVLFQQLIPMRGFQSTVDPRLHFGLGNHDRIDSLKVLWPDDQVNIIYNPDINQILEINMQDAGILHVPNPNAEHQIFKELRGMVEYTHQENEFNDFEREKLIFQMMSNSGPAITKGDINSDGLVDIHIGGAKDQAGTIFIQQPDGNFIESRQEVLEDDKSGEDTDAVFFDVDNDNDLDLYVARGGNEFPSSSSALIDRLYLNDGNGKFSRSDEIFPAGKFESTSCVDAADFDMDGDIDLFVGIRLRPFLYGVPVNGYILQNDGKGNFTNVTQTIAPELMKIGMITDMLWEDLDNDRDQDIILVGEYMGIVMFINENGKFSKFKNDLTLEESTGWWNTIEKADLDQDGDMDFIVGNHGLNSRFKASIEKPVTMYVNDFDRNGRVEQVITRYNGDTSYPMVLRNDMIMQIPSLEAKYPDFNSYKTQRMEDIFTDDQIRSSETLMASYLPTAVLVNTGNMEFTLTALPREAQLSPVFAILADDFNNDGHMDILLGGNQYRAKPETGIYDGSYGVLLLGDGKNNFAPVQESVSGFFVPGEIRDLVSIPTEDGRMLLVGRNNDSLKTFEYNLDNNYEK